MSASLTWELLHSNNCFVVKRNGIQLSREPGNILGVHSFIQSGLAQPKAVDIKRNKSGAIAVATKSRGKFLPAMVFKKNAGIRCIKAAVAKQVSSYRPDLVKASLGRVKALVKGAAPKKTVKRRMRANKLKKLGASSK